jgi:hypothetical protein
MAMHSRKLETAADFDVCSRANDPRSGHRHGQGMRQTVANETVQGSGHDIRYWNHLAGWPLLMWFAYPSVSHGHLMVAVTNRITPGMSGVSRLRLPTSAYSLSSMEKKIFWTVFAFLGLLADVMLPFWWTCAHGALLYA